MTEQDMSWVESGYISHHTTTANQFPTDDDSTVINSTVYDEDDTITEQPTELDCVHVKVRDTTRSVQSTTSTISLLLGGFTDCMQPVKTALSSVKGYFNPYKFEGKDINVDAQRDYYSHGMEGTILKAKHLGHDVAVKQLLNQQSFNPALIEKLARSRPKNIVLFLGYTIDPPQYIMEFLPHGTLESYIREGGEIAPKLLVRWSGNIVDGLETLHKLNVIHCDMKSANLMIDCLGEGLKIIDLESSVVIPEGSDQVPMSRVRGTTPYMSPEMIQQLPCTTMVDIWAFGVILWQMVTLKAPYKGKGEEYVFYGIGMNKISLPIPDDIPDGIKLLLQMCWKQAPEARPSAFYIKKHLEELARELEATSNETYRHSQMSWREDCKYVEYDFDPQEIAQWKRDMESYRKSYRMLQMQYSALRTCYNDLYQEYKKLKKEQEPPEERSFCRKKMGKKKKKAASKASLLFAGNQIELTRTVSAPEMATSSNEIIDKRLCLTPKSNTLGNSGNVVQGDLHSPFEAYNECTSPIESDDSRGSSQARGHLGDIESGAESSSDPDRIVLSQHLAVRHPKLSDSENEDSAFDLSLSSQQEMSGLGIPQHCSSMIIGEEFDEFGEESLDRFGVKY